MCSRGGGKGEGNCRQAQGKPGSRASAESAGAREKRQAGR
jgi:hypothetical protein